ncbi:MAG: hypothetical protein M3347_13100, partial [Armatimonadota bacterium]|nr:hypothetical protein [Armatimonadota bacterium]
GLMVAFFSVSSTKLITYVLPAFPALAVLIGEALSRLHCLWPREHAEKNSPLLTKEGSGEVLNAASSDSDADDYHVSHPLWRWIMGGTLVLLASAAFLGALIFLKDDKLLPRAEVYPSVLLFLLILPGAKQAMKWAWRSGDGWRIGLTQSAAAMATLILLFNVAGKVALYKDSSSMVQALRPHLQSGDRFIEADIFQPTAIFYLARPVFVLNFKNTSGLDEEALARSPYFASADSKTLAQLMAGPQRVFVLFRRQPSDLHIPDDAYVLARNNDNRIISNRPPPAGFHFDFTAPGRRYRGEQVLQREQALNTQR